jgi:integrase/recombinase XerD
VGEAIVDYVRKERKDNSRVWSLSAKTSRSFLKDASMLNTLLRDAFERTALKPLQKYVGSHLLRRSLTTDMPRKRASLDQITAWGASDRRFKSGFPTNLIEFGFQIGPF